MTVSDMRERAQRWLKKNTRWNPEGDLANEFARIRTEALEEAARACEHEAGIWSHISAHYAECIRALKDK